jgi:xanthine dehydrogenase accessory factor
MVPDQEPDREGPVTARELAKRSLSPSGPFVEATVVRAQSPTSVRAGDAALVRPDGTIDGFVGGTCAESSVRLHALRALETGEPLLLRILPGGAEGEPPAGEGAVVVQNPCLSGGALEIFLEPHLPAATLRVVGQSPIALALADLGRWLGFAVELDAPEASEPRAADAALLVASHGRGEERVLTAALREGVPYVGLVASEVRGDAVRQSLELSEELRAKLRTPAGLEIGARTPEEIALAVLAEIVALRRSQADGGKGTPVVAAGAERPAESAIAPPAPATPARAATPTEVALDPVCGMEVVVSAASIQLERDGQRHFFCSEGCRDRFATEDASDVAAR